MTDTRTPLVEMKNISISFGGIHAVDNASVDLYPGEVVALLGHNGAGKSTLIKVLSGAYKRDSGEILINGEPAEITNPRDAKKYGIETIYQTLAVADNVDAHWLLVHGDLDKEVAVTHAQKLSDVARKGDAESVDLVIVRGVNHVLQPAVTGDVGEYQKLAARGVSPDVSSAVVGWLQRTLPEPRRN